MKVNCRTEYALKALADLAALSRRGEAVPLAGIARRRGIPYPFLEQIMLVLKHAGYVESRRGKGGGFQLARPPHHITLGEIVRLLGGPIQQVTCGACGPGCGDRNACAFREVWDQVAAAVETVVDGVTFRDIVERESEMKQRRGANTYQI